MLKRGISGAGAHICDSKQRAIVLAAGGSRDLDRTAGTATPFSEDHNWPACEEVRDFFRLHIIDVESCELHVDSSQNRRVDVAAEACSRLFGLTGSGYDRRLSEPCVSDSLDQVAIHAGTNAECEEVRLMKLFPNIVEYLAFRIKIGRAHV